MKLNPPASSSDIEVARAIARRLHKRARGSEPASDAAAPPSPAYEGAAPPEPGRPLAPTPSIRPEALEPEPPELEAIPPVLEPEPPELEVTPPALEPEPPELEAIPPEPPELSVPEAPEAPSPPGLFEPELPGGFEADTGAFEPEPPEPPPAVGESPFEPEPPGGYTVDAGTHEQGLPGGPAAEEPSWGEEEGELPEDAIGGNAALDGLEPSSAAGVSPEDLLPEEPLSEQSWSEPSPLEAEVEAPGEEPATAAEDLVEVPEQSWDDVADSCLALAPAHGAMLVDPAGQVLTARGEWPEPGPEAIAGRLVSMMEKKLRDAPTRSVSAPLAGQHLTAWRVPSDDGDLTVVFMAEAPLRADVRPAIDTTIQAAGG